MTALINSLHMFSTFRTAVFSLVFVLVLSCNRGGCEDIAFDDLNMSSTMDTTVPAPEADKTVSLGSYTIDQTGKVISHSYFERDLDAPPFYNFVSTETNTLTGFQRTNGGTCFGISMVTLRYFQWFILPSLLTDTELEAVRGKKLFGFGKPKTKRTLPSYAKKMAADFNLPDWVLLWPAGSQKERTAKIAPYRLRTYLTKNKLLAQKVEGALKDGDLQDASQRLDPEIAKEHSVRMFDNQMGLMRKGSQLYEMINRFIHDKGDSDNKAFKALFGRCAFDEVRKQIEDKKYGCTEFGFWSSRLKEMWGHSVVAFKITEHKAVNTTSNQRVKAFKVHLYDNNDPFNTSDDAFWYFSDTQKFNPSDQYADFYDGSNPLRPAGEEFMKSMQLGPSSENLVLRFEENVMNKFSFKMETVEIQD